MRGKIFFTLKENRTWKTVCFFLAWIYLAFLFLDFFLPSQGRLSSYLKFFSILLLSLSQYILGKKGAGLWIGASFLTILTDYFLLFTSFYSLGVFFFLWVHLFRFLHRKEKRGEIFLFLSLLGIGIFFLLKKFFPSLEVLAFIYAGLLILNTLEAFKSRDKKLFVAYLLFCFCDLSVAVANFPGSQSLGNLFRKFIWAFYLPSQVLLGDQIIKEGKYNKKE